MIGFISITALLSLIAGAILKWYISPDMISSGHAEGAKIALWASDQLLISGSIILPIWAALVFFSFASIKNSGLDPSNISNKAEK